MQVLDSNYLSFLDSNLLLCPIWLLLHLPVGLLQPFSRVPMLHLALRLCYHLHRPLTVQQEFSQVFLQDHHLLSTLSLHPQEVFKLVGRYGPLHHISSLLDPLRQFRPQHHHISSLLDPPHQFHPEHHHISSVLDPPHHFRPQQHHISSLLDPPHQFRPQQHHISSLLDPPHPPLPPLASLQFHI